MWNSLPNSLFAGGLGFTDANPVANFALVCCHISATHFDGFEPALPSLPSTSVVRKSSKRLVRPQGLRSLLKKTLHSAPCIVSMSDDFLQSL